MKIHTAVLAALVAAPGFAQETSPTEMEPVVVTATRSEQADMRLPASVRVITAADIAASGARHLVDVLRDAANLQVTDFYGDGSRAQVDARAFGDAANANTLVLVDGRRLNNPDIATPDLNSIALKDVERIEIIEGSAGALYGDQATGGVINVVTRRARGRGLDAGISGGSYGDVGAQVALDAAGEWLSARLSAAHRGSDNYRAHNRLDYRNYLGRGGVRWDGGDAFLEIGYVNEDLETPGALFASEMQQDRRQSTANFQNDFSDTVTRLDRLGAQHALGDWTLVLEHTRRRSDGTFRLSSAAFGPASQDAAQTRELRSVNPRLTGRIPLLGRDAQITAGADFLRAEYELRSQFGAQRNEQRQSDGYAQAIVPLPAAFDLTVGGRTGRVRNTVQDGFTFTVPTTFADDESAAQLGLSWRGSALRLYARGDRAYRYAKVDEFTFTSAGFGSNRNELQTQQGDTLEAGAEWSGGAFGLAGTLFRLDTEQEIAFDPTGGPSGFGANLNLPQTRRDGALLRARWQALSWLQLAAGGQYVDAQITRGSLAGRDIPLAAAKIAHGAATLSLPAGLGVQLGVSYTGRRAYAGDFDNSLGQLPSHAVTRLALGWEWRALRLSARVDNLLDREYSAYGASGIAPGTFAEAPAYLPSPERSFSLAARLEL